MTTNDSGFILCPKCNSKMVLRGDGKAYRCGAPGNRWTGSAWTVCDGQVWVNKARGVFKQPIVRATDFPLIPNPTREQKEIRKVFSLAPAVRGGRCMVDDAGPGTAKTTTISWSLQAAFARLGSLFGYGLRAFNVNAANVLLGKLPPEVPDISTLHSAGKQAQGHKGMADLSKIRNAYNSLVQHIKEKDKRPSIGKLKTVLERSRALCLWTTTDDVSGWNQIVSTVLARFPGLMKNASKEAEKHLRDYLPHVAAICLADGRKLDFSDMITRPVILAMQRTGWRMRTDLVLKHAKDWTDEDVAHFAKLVRCIELPAMKGLVIDEAQDLDLAQIATILAQTWRTGELTLIGDDQAGEPGQEGYKAGQAIYGWRGAFGGSLTLIARLWKELTGEEVIRKSLTVTFRHGPEICDAYRPLNTVIQSAQPAGNCGACVVGPDAAFHAWLALPNNASALWITRTNAAMSEVFLDTLREHADCTIRGGGDFSGAITGALYEAAGAPDDQGEYKVSFDKCMEALRLYVNGNEGEEVDPNSLEAFCLEVGEALQKDISLLQKAQIADKRLTVGNLRRFILYFADKASRRVITTVYRCKGDEADLAIVGDVGKFNESWGDAMEDAACRHVALSRAKRLLLTVGKVMGSNMEVVTDDKDMADYFQDAD